MIEGLLAITKSTMIESWGFQYKVIPQTYNSSKRKLIDRISGTMVEDEDRLSSKEQSWRLMFGEIEFSPSEWGEQGSSWIFIQ